LGITNPDGWDVKVFGDGRAWLMNHSPQSKEKIYRAKGACIGGVGVALPRFRTPLTGLTGTACWSKDTPIGLGLATDPDTLSYHEIFTADKDISRRVWRQRRLHEIAGC